MSVPEKADVVVLGGGPAGSLCAGLLAKKGFEVVLLERAQHPRPVVGESILPHFWRFMDMLGATERMEQEGFVIKAGGIVKWGDSIRRTRFRDFGHKRPAIHADREIFDKIILDAARDCGVQVFENHTALTVDLEGDLKTVTYRPLDRSTGEAGDRKEIKASIVVDATGQTALVAKQYGFREFDDNLQFSAVWSYYKGGNYFDFDANLRSFDERFVNSPVTFVESTGGWGWTWQIVLKNSISIGFIMPKDQLNRFRAQDGSREERFQEMVCQTPILGGLMKDAEYRGDSVNAIRDYAYKPTRLSLDGCYLVGDAAAFVDPINSSGVTFGMYAAVLAAWGIESTLRRPTKAEYYRMAFEQQYRQRLEIFRLVALPEGIELTGEEMDSVTNGFGFFSEEEKQLALTTTMLTCRPGKVRGIFDRLKVEQSAIFSELSPESFKYLQAR